MTRLRLPAAPCFAAVLAALAVPAAGHAQAVSRTFLKPDAPIASTVTVPAGSELIYLSGVIPPVADPNAPRGSAAMWGGDTEAQATAALTRIEATLKNMRLSLGDVVMMRVFLAGDASNGGRMDFEGWSRAYAKFFGTKAQPMRPARSTFQVAALAAPGALVEIEVTVARPRPPAPLHPAALNQPG